MTFPRTINIQSDSNFGGWDYAGSLTTALAGANNDLTYTGKSGNATDNDTTIRYVVSGTSTALSVAVAGTAITVNVATNGGGAATSTAAQVKTAVDAAAPAAALVTVANATGNDGTGVVTALSATPLAGGASKTVNQGGGTTRVVAWNKGG